ncbi:MAG TPA: cytidylate kinase family protein, partial [Gemmatimonadales bacterium]|nr:cytidylate kinase family protein [Gemmatimonadales bacterium]
AVAVLAQRQDALHVRLVGAAKFRAAVVMEGEGIGREEALKRIKEVDANRARYHRQFYHRDWHDPVNYHVTINTGLVGLERATDIVAAAAWPLVNPAG